MRAAVPLAVVLALIAAVPASGGKRADRCAASGSKTVRETSAVRVYGRSGNLYGCLRKSGARRKLFGGQFIPNQFDDVGLVRIAGRRVAFTHTSGCTVCGRDDNPYSTIHEVELRSGARRRLAPVRERPEGMGVRIDALALDHCGRVAYRAVLASTYVRVREKDPQLHLWSPGAARRELDRGTIDRRSIRLDRDAVHWTNAGESRAAPLDRAC